MARASPASSIGSTSAAPTPASTCNWPIASLPAEARAAFFAEYGEISEDSETRARVVALSLGAILARYGRDQGLPEIEREALASLDRATADL